MKQMIASGTATLEGQMAWLSDLFFIPLLLPSVAVVVLFKGHVFCGFGIQETYEFEKIMLIDSVDRMLFIIKTFRG